MKKLRSVCAVYIKNEQDRRRISYLTRTLMREAVRLTCVMEGYMPRLCEVSITLTDDASIRELNRDYRTVDRPTDVLSFLEEPDEAAWLEPDARRSLGEIVVCPDVVARYAEEDGVPYVHQLGWTLVHGALHLLGYDHECDQGQMRARESQLVQRFKEDFPRLSLERQ